MATPPIAEQHAGRVLSGRYRLLGAIGTGASATVHLADDGTLRRRVAVKVLHPGLAADEAFLRRFRAEAQSAAALSHPNIMAVYDWGEDGTTPYLVLELLSGGSLRGILDRGNRLSVSQALVVGLHAAQALEAAHRRGFVHRDIKPANLLFGEDGRLRIADFGLARALSEAAWSEQGGGLVGTARYAAPEQAGGGRVDGKADVYSLALVLVEAVTGEVPRIGESALATIKLRADEAVPVPDALGPLQPILQRALQPDPAARPEAAELVRSLLATSPTLDRPAPLPLAGIGDPANEAGLQDLTVLPDHDHTVLGHATAIHPEPGPPEAMPRRRRRWKRVVIPLLLVLALVAGALYLYRATAPPAVPVPTLAGLSEGEAREEIEAALLASEEDVVWDITTESEFSDGVAKGAIIRTEPDAGDELADEGELALIISDGPEPVPVPQLVDVDEAGARALLEDAQLTLGDVVEEPSEDIPAGRVTGWTVEGVEKPAEAPKGTPVDIRVSSGPAPREVPNLAGKTYDEAVAALQAVQLRAERVEEFSDDVPEGQVVRSDPGAGGEAARDSVVTVVVSKGPDLVTVPDVVGMRYSDAYDRLVEAGFVVKDSKDSEGNRVVETDPAGGSKAKRGSTVVVTRRR